MLLVVILLGLGITGAIITITLMWLRRRGYSAVTTIETPDSAEEVNQK